MAPRWSDGTDRLPTNHIGIALLPDRLYRLTRDYLDSELNGRRFPRTKLREYAIPAVKVSVFTGLESRLTAGLGVEYPILYTRRNRPVLTAEGMWTGRGLFAGLGIPLRPFYEAGVAWRVWKGRGRISPFFSISLAF